MRYYTSIAVILTIFLLSHKSYGKSQDMSYFESLQENQKIAGFSVVNVYENAGGKAMGAKFIADRYDFILDLLQIQSVPQCFYWIKTVPKWDKGEPHTCEHLLLGKGNRGRYVAVLEEMSLGSSSAFTGQIVTAYHFNTIAGEETFYSIFEAKLNAFLHPDFKDEEIRREVCHVGIVVDPEDGGLSIEEKGTVYTEMVSAFEKPWYYLEQPMNEMLYGIGHPLTNISGGAPAAIRTMTAEDLWNFHREFHHLSNMGAIVSIPENIPVERCLNRIAGILDSCQGYPDSTEHTGIGGYDFPDPASDELSGLIKVVDYPGENLSDPGEIQFAWKPQLDYNLEESLVLDIFLSTFSSGSASNLYKLLIDSQTRKTDIGAAWVYGSSSKHQGHPVYIHLGGPESSRITEQEISDVRDLILGELTRVYNYEGGSDELWQFNRRAESHLASTGKWYNRFLNSPPMFGFRRGPAGAWLNILEKLEEEDGFRKSLVMKNYLDSIKEYLSSERNIWRDYFDRWKLLDDKPYAVGIKPNPKLLENASIEKNQRIADYIEGFRQKYAVETDEEAIARYKEEFDRKTVEMEAQVDKQDFPGFIENPPLTLDDQLEYEVLTLPGAVPLVASTFDAMTSPKIGIAFRLDVIPESMMVYLPILRDVLTQIGVYKDGELIKHDEMQNRLRRELFWLSAYHDMNMVTGRIEIVLGGSGANKDELLNVLDWMEAALFSPYLSVENIPRMLDIIDQKLVSLRNTMKRSEEAWIEGPADAYRYQQNPLYLSISCFMTKIHHLQRLKWLLTDAGDNEESREIDAFLNTIAEAGTGKNRTQLIQILDYPAIIPKSEKSQKLAESIIKELKSTLNDIPDENLAGDWIYLCEEIKSDLMVDPAYVISELKETLSLLLKSDNARMFLVSSGSDREASIDRIVLFVEKLDMRTTSTRQEYAATPRIEARLKSRVSGDFKPVYVGLVNKNTRNGTLIFSARNSGAYDTSRSAVLDALAGKLFGGGAEHSLFMKTWSAGLAYSNGISYRDRSGLLRYYAERCPDVAETMRFVVDIIKGAEDNPKLTEYVTALTFGDSRAASKYEERGEAMAEDLADGFTPDVVSEYRRKILSLRNSEDLYSELQRRMEKVYSTVLIGYGAPLSEADGGCYFLNGPEEQFQSLENYIAKVEGARPVYRLYPRDFWLIK